jgi:uncharacterized membrane protein HdeD (DUF308 family)
MIDALARNWWAVALRGAAAVIFGLLAIVLPDITLTALVLLFGAYALVDGVFALVAAVNAYRTHRQWGPLVLEGVGGVVIGLITLVSPDVTTLALLYLIAAWAIVTGVLEIAAAIALRREIRGELWLGLAGLASLAFGIVLIVAPVSGALAIVWLIGSYALVFGAVLIALALRLRGLRSGGGRGLARPGAA